MGPVVRSIAVAAALGLLLVASDSIAATKRFRATGAPGTFAWEPTARSIAKGDKIVWKNETQTQHTVTAWKGPWSKDTALPPDQSTAKVFKKTGVFKFRCLTGAGTELAHSTVENGKCSGMCGKVHVH